MRILFLILFVTITVTLCGQTQAEMNKQAGDSYRKVDQTLNEIYKKILVEYKSDTAFIRNIKTSQRIWITFRDSEVKMKYPDREPGYYGSIHPICVFNYLEKLTQDRINTLKEWLDKANSGDGCGGSIKF